MPTHQLNVQDCLTCEDSDYVLFKMQTFSEQSQVTKYKK